MCKKKKEKQKKPTNRKNRAVCFFWRHKYLNTYVQRDTEKERERQGNCLPSAANKERKEKMTTTAKKEKRERESDDHAHTHTQTRASTSSKWHSRRSEKKKRERETDKKNGTQERNLVVEQWTKDPHKFSHSSQKISRNKKEKNGEGKKERKKTNKQMIGCFINRSSMTDPKE